MLRSFVAAAILFAVSGCAPTAFSIGLDLEPPPPSRFPDRELAYRYPGTIEQTRDLVVTYLTAHRLPHRTVLNAPYTYVITVWVPDSIRSAARRVRRSAFSIRLADASPNPCTSAALNWVVESRGIHEEVWTAVEADGAFHPLFADSLIALLSTSKCASP